MLCYVVCGGVCRAMRSVPKLFCSVEQTMLFGLLMWQYAKSGSVCTRYISVQNWHCAKSAESSLMIALLRSCSYLNSEKIPRQMDPSKVLVLTVLMYRYRLSTDRSRCQSWSLCSTRGFGQGKSACDMGVSGCCCSHPAAECDSNRGFLIASEVCETPTRDLLKCLLVRPL